jgi:ferritin-like metal-binding protein YciE
MESRSKRPLSGKSGDGKMPLLDSKSTAWEFFTDDYEISRYGTLIAWAEELGLEDAVSLFEETLEEEEATDEALTEIAKTAINQQAEAA